MGKHSVFSVIFWSNLNNNVCATDVEPKGIRVRTRKCLLTNDKMGVRMAHTVAAVEYDRHLYITFTIRADSNLIGTHARSERYTRAYSWVLNTDATDLLCQSCSWKQNYTRTPVFSMRLYRISTSSIHHHSYAV